MTGKAVALANNDVALVAWSVDARIDGCIGFTIHRLAASDSNDAAGTPLPAPDIHSTEDDEGLWTDTDRSPIRKFSWRDLAAPHNTDLKYRVTAVTGEQAHPQPMPGSLISNVVRLSPKCDTAAAYFNRGIISTQAVSRDLLAQGKLNAVSLVKLISQPNYGLRKSMAGDLTGALLSLLEKADGGGSIFASLYELTDSELIDHLLLVKDLHLILSNNNDDTEGPVSPKTGKPTTKIIYDGKNAHARTALRSTAKELINRYMPAGHIGHNKFVVYVDAGGTARAVLTGSTNWTATGLCTQSNNAIIVESRELAAGYLAYWQHLKTDSLAAGDSPKAPAAPNKGLQGDTLRSLDHAAPLDCGIGSAALRAWFSPNTDWTEHKGMTTTNSKGLPIDVSEVFELMGKARSAILFLAFQPGTPSIVERAEEIVRKRQQQKLPPLLIRGAMTDIQAAEGFEGYLKEMVGDLTGPTERVRLVHRADTLGKVNDLDASVIGYASIPEAFAYWKKELDKAGHAVIHNKIVVIDPFDDECVVITGSHNLGARASTNNDENLLIVRGDKSLAAAYTAHVMDVYEHYRWRWYQYEQRKTVKGRQPRSPAGTPKPTLKPFAPDTSWIDDLTHWQDKYFQPGHLALYERLFWVATGGGGQALNDGPGDIGSRAGAPQ